MFRMLILRMSFFKCKCICIGKPCFCRKRKSLYSLVPIESAFWCNLSAFTFSASEPLNECLWITFPAISQFLVYLFSSFVCLRFPSFWFTYSAVLHVQGSKKKKIHSRTQVFKTRVHTGEILSPDALFRPRAYKNRASGHKKISPDALFRPKLTKTEHLGKKKFPQWILSLRDSSSY